MPRVNAVISESPIAKRAASSMMDQKNPTAIDLNNVFLRRKIEYYVYIYNCSSKQFMIPRQWAHPNVIIPGCNIGEAYSRPFIIPDVVTEIQPTRSGFGVNGVDGKFLAQDVLMPEDPQGSWQTYRPIDAGTATSFGTDLYKWGVWWSLNEDPDPDSPEVLAARTRLETTYTLLLEEAHELATLGKKVSLDMHRAADYYGITPPWHQRFEAKVPCEGCGAMVSATIARHMPKDLCGFVRDWPRAIKGGMATKAEAKAAGIEIAD